MDEKYSERSYLLTKQLQKEDKRKQGIYFTPPKCVLNTLQKLKQYIDNSQSKLNILEPSCGSCEFISKLTQQYPSSNIVGIEKNSQIYESIKELNKDNLSIIHTDFLTYEPMTSSNTASLYDLIIGNPPYFVMKKTQVDSKYYDFYTGRPNIFILFILKCLNMLEKNGVLAFVLPKSFLNCVYYDRTRAYIHLNFQILDISESTDKYIETQQPTIVFILKNTKITAGNTKYVLEKNGFTIFGPEKQIKELTTLYEDSKTLYNLGFRVSVGKVVWNQCKSILTDDKTKTRLIYSSDIVNGELSMKKYKNKDKKNYIDKPGIHKPMMILNRGYGVGKYCFNYCILDGSITYLIENHLICIEYKKKIIKNRLMTLFHKIEKSFQNEKTNKFISLYFGNSAINTTELANILPIYNM